VANNNHFVAKILLDEAPYKCGTYSYFVKQELKGVLKYRGKKLDPLPLLTVTDILLDRLAAL
jgi:hypothetical protein